MSLPRWIEVESLEEFARLDGPAQRLDPRAKVLVTLAFIVCVMSFPRADLSPLAPYALFPLVLAAWSRIPLPYLLRKLLPALPFALAVAVFNPLIERTPALQAGPVTLSEGWLSLMSVLARFLLTVSAALLLAGSTGMHRLCGGLERLGLPRVFAVQVLFLHRYLFVIADEGGRMTRGLAVRGGRVGRLPLRTAAPLLGHLLLRAMARADRVYQAMEARGFDGEIRTAGRFSWSRRETVFTAGWLAFFAAARAWNGADWLGRWLLGGGA